MRKSNRTGKRFIRPALPQADLPHGVLVALFKLAVESDVLVDGEMTVW